MPRGYSTLKQLDLSWNGIRMKGAVELASALTQNTSLSALDIAWNGFSVEGSEHIGMTLASNTTLRFLNISHNSVEARSAIVIANNLKRNSTLTNLQMNGNSLGNAGGRALLRCMDTTGDVRIIGLEGKRAQAAQWVETSAHGNCTRSPPPHPGLLGCCRLQL